MQETTGTGRILSLSSREAHRAACSPVNLRNVLSCLVSSEKCDGTAEHEDELYGRRHCESFIASFVRKMLAGRRRGCMAIRREASDGAAVNATEEGKARDRR